MPLLGGKVVPRTHLWRGVSDAASNERFGLAWPLGDFSCPLSLGEIRIVTSLSDKGSSSDILLLRLAGAFSQAGRDGA